MQEIRERKATGHDICDICSKIQIERARWENRTDEEARKRMKELDEEQARHDADKDGERAYAEDTWFKGEHFPERVTALNMDAPTERQFDVPMQKRKSHDGMKSLASAPKWRNKMTGVLAAGVGMYTYITRSGLGSGPNLSCTALYLTLLALVRENKPIGARPPPPPSIVHALTSTVHAWAGALTPVGVYVQVHTSTYCWTTRAAITRTMRWCSFLLG